MPLCSWTSISRVLQSNTTETHRDQRARSPSRSREHPTSLAERPPSPAQRRHGHNTACNPRQYSRPPQRTRRFGGARTRHERHHRSRRNERGQAHPPSCSQPHRQGARGSRQLRRPRAQRTVNARTLRQRHRSTTLSRTRHPHQTSRTSRRTRKETTSSSPRRRQRQDGQTSKATDQDGNTRT